MKIAMFAEGSYPYVAGGVSGWVQMLTEELKEKEFVIYTLVPAREDGGKFKYQISSNVREIRESYLNGSGYVEKKKKVILKNKERESLWSLLFGENIDWGGVFDFFDQTEYSVNDLLMSKDFMELTRRLYIEKYPNCVYLELQKVQCS